MAIRYSDFRGHAPITQLSDLPDAVGDVRTVASGRWKLGAPITLPDGERLVIADGATLSGDEHTEHVIFGNVDGEALLTFEGDGGAGEGRSPQGFSVVNNSATGDGIHYIGADSAHSFVSFKMYARGGRYGFCASGTCNAIVCSDALFEGDTAGALIEAEAQFLRIRDVRLDGASAAEVVCDGSSISQAEFLRCAVVPTTNGLVLTEANGGALGAMIVADVSGVTAPNPLVGISESESRYTGRDNTALPNSPSTPTAQEVFVYTLSDLTTNLNASLPIDVPLLGAASLGGIAGLAVVGNTLVAAKAMIIDAYAHLFVADSPTAGATRGVIALYWERTRGLDAEIVSPAGANNYIRNSSGSDEAGPRTKGIIDLQAGDVLRLKSARIAGAGTMRMDDRYPSQIQLKRIA